MGRMKDLHTDMVIARESRKQAFRDASVEQAQDAYDKSVTDYYEGDHK